MPQLLFKINYNCKQIDLLEHIMIIHKHSLVLLKYYLLTMSIMEGVGIFEMLEWYVIGFSVTLGSLHLISKLNILKRGERKPTHIEYTYNISK